MLSVAERAELPGISAPRARQSLAGAIVGHTAMKLSDVKTVTICPWALREGVLVRYLEDGADWFTDLAAHDGEPSGSLEGAGLDVTPLRRVLRS
ncbi:Ppx/GppA phosphatase family protein [Streptomyces brasiliscabiei]